MLDTRIKDRWQAGRLRALANVLLWPLVSVIAIAIGWTFVAARSGADRSAAEASALREVTSLAQSYEQFLTRSVSQMDHVTMQLRYDWERSRGRFEFENLLKQGMFTESAFASVGIYDRQGQRRTATREASAPVSVANTPSFISHRDNISTALGISLVSASTDGTRQIQFSRRLDTSDDGFDGVIIIVMDASYFTSFYNTSSLGTEGVVAFLAERDEGRIEQTGLAMQAKGPLLQMPSAFFMREEPSSLQPGAQFSDNVPRFVGWQRSSAYPLVAIAGLSSQEKFALTDRADRERQSQAALATIALLAFAVVAAFISHRLALRQQEQEAIRAAYRTATDHANDGFYMVSPVRDTAQSIIDFDIVDCNERGAWFYSMSRVEMVGRRLSSLPGATANAGLMLKYDQALLSGQTEEDVQMPVNSRIRVEWVQRTLVRTDTGFAVTLHDISRQKRHETELLRLANEDTLTCLPNRYWLLNHLPRAIDRAARNDATLALLFIDLDGFKHVNDTQGHAVGDGLLKVAAERLASLLRPCDNVVRFGGDEFIVVLNPLESIDHASHVAQRILDAFNLPFAIDEDVQQVGASVGISIFPADGEDAMTLIKHGDIAMYSGKSEGKGQFRFFEKSLYERLTAREQGKQALLQAMEQDQLLLHFQPRVDTFTGELCSMEALVRWLHPQRGMIPPLEFIGMAEENGLIAQLGEIVMQKACRQIAAWRDAGLPLVPVSINVSATQFSQGKVHQQLAASLAAYNVPARLLEVEITESSMMGDQVDTITELTAIRALGVKLHIDDFGTGYSSLSQLQKLKMDVLKVDRAFTIELGHSHDGKVFFQAIVSMAHALGMTVVAEGVETVEQLAILQSLACNEVQGYLISRPVMAQEMAHMMQRRFLFPQSRAAA